jgi:PhnB protein
MAERVSPIPEGLHSVTPNLVIKGASKAIDWYKQALGAQELYRMPGPDGRIMHAEIKIGDSVIMLTDEMPEMGGKGPQMLGGTPVSLMIYC